MGPVQDSIQAKLTACFSPSYMNILNESNNHSGPRNRESHFKIVVVSDAFKGKTPIQRHRAVNEALKEEFANGLHALSIDAKTPEQWNLNSITIPSPTC
eukprot:Ihof_evm16s21 gene=Ihof_evmTU16s21